MNSFVINIKDESLKDKVLWLLEHFKNDGLEIVSKEDLDDLKLLKASREDETIDFEEYLKNCKKEEDKEMALEYIGNRLTPEADIHWDYIRLAMRSVADTCIIPVQDYLGLGCEARINTPSTLGGNWIWRSDADSFTDNLAAKIKKITQLCARSLQQKGE